MRLALDRPLRPLLTTRLATVLTTALTAALTTVAVLPLLASPAWSQETEAVERPSGEPPAAYAAKAAAWEAHQALDEASLFRGLEWRSIGPVVQGGRVVDIEAVPGKPYSFVVAYASGGLWRTDDNGVNFEPIFDQQPTLIMGDVAIDPNDADRLWVGTGENNSSRSSYGGMGVYRTDDGGESWRHVGLGDSDRIGRVLVDPRDGDRVYVGALGKLYTPGGERGVYRTTDGGATWQQVLDTSADGWTGVIDLAMDPSNADVLYAAAWHRQRRPWDFVEGGEGSAVYKSTDGGDTWARLGGGFPTGPDIGRIGLSIAASDPKILYASVDHQEELPEDQWDLGDSPLSVKRLRTMTNEELLAHDKDTLEGFIRVNDLDTDLDADGLIDMLEAGDLTIADLVEELSDANANLFNTDIRGLEIYRSDDAGATWRRTHDEPLREVVYTYGYYFGQIRVDPTNPDKVFALGVPMIVSEDGGTTWQGANGRGVHVDYQSGWIDPEHSDRIWIGNDGGIDASYDGGKTWIKIDSQPVGQIYALAVDMEDPYNVYAGLQDNGTLKGSSLSRPGLDAWQMIGGGDGMQIAIDPRDGTTYTGFQFGFYFSSDGRTIRPRDKLKEPALRYNWQTPIMLSSHNADVMYYGSQKLYRSLDRGETWTAISPDLATSEERGDVPFATIATLSESPEQFGLLWVGTDDGALWVSDDGGVEWRSVDAGLPRDRWVSRVEASNHERQRAYATLNGYRQDDITPYVYVTEDLGASWTSIASNLPAEAVNVVREDPENADVLYVGTDSGAYVSLDRGGSWQSLPGGMPNTSVHDLVVHPRERELVAGTHGRSAYILDVLPIQELVKHRDQPVHLFPPRDVTFERGWRGKRSRWFADLADPVELALPFWSASSGKATVSILDADDRPLRTFEVDAEHGINTAVWDLELDSVLALAAEQAKLTAKEPSSKDSKKKRAKTKKKAENRAKTGAEDAKPPKGSKAEQPWAEAQRLGWPLYVTPGSYTIKVILGDASSEADLTVEPPEPLEPRKAPEPKIRGQKDDH